MASPFDTDNYKWWEKGLTYAENFTNSRDTCHFTNNPIYHENITIISQDKVGGIGFMISLEGAKIYCNTVKNRSCKFINKYTDELNEVRISTRKITNNIENIRCNRCKNKIETDVVEIYEKGNISERKCLHMDCALELKEELNYIIKKAEQSPFKYINRTLCITLGRKEKCKICEERLNELGYVIAGKHFQICGKCAEGFLNKITEKYNKHIYQVNYDKNQSCEVCGIESRSLKGKIVEFTINGSSLNLHKTCTNKIVKNITKEDIDKIRNSYMIKGLTK